jgi:uncharacterized membrane protein YbhN (UPF0104 family)
MSRPPPGRSGLLGTALKLAVALALLGWLWVAGALDLAAIARAARDPVWVVETFSVLLAGAVIITVRWWLLLRLEGIDVSLLVALKLNLVAGLWNNFLPGAVTGDVVKMYYLGRKSPDKKTEVYATVVLDRFLGLAALVYLAFLAGLANLDFVLAHRECALTFLASALAALACTVALLGLIVCAGLHVPFPERLASSRLPGADALRRSSRTLVRLGERPSIVLASLVLGVLSHATHVLVGILSARALGEDRLVWTIYGFLLPIGYFVNAIPFGLPGGLGAGEKALEVLLVWAGGAPALGPGIMLLNRISGLPWALIGAVVYVFDRAALAPKEDAAGPPV